jgi:MraZ protein
VSGSFSFGGSGLSGIDSKGRTTIPAEIRDVVQKSSEGNIVCIGRHRELPCLVGYGRSERQQNREIIEEMKRAAILRGEAFDDEEYGAPASSLYEINFEASGRFVLSPMLRHFGKLTSRVFFHGTDTKFLLWDPEIFLAEAPAKFRQAREELEYWLSVQGKGA